MLEWLKVIILGIVEGITEWLPVSSTGHLILVEKLVNLQVGDDFKEMFNVVIQLGAIMAVVVLYFEKLNPFSKRKNQAQKRRTIQLWLKVIVATIPAAVIGFLLDDYVEAHFMNEYVVATMLILYGILFIVVENRHEGQQAKINSLSRLTYPTIFVIGLFQVLAAIFPGTSRSGATILGGIWMGVSRSVAAEFTFFLAIPVMFGASLLKIVKFGFSFTAQEVLLLLTGCVVSFGVSMWAIRFLMQYVKKHDFKIFAYWRIGLGVLVLLYFCVIGG